MQTRQFVRAQFTAISPPTSVSKSNTASTSDTAWTVRSAPAVRESSWATSTAQSKSLTHKTDYRLAPARHSRVKAEQYTWRGRKLMRTTETVRLSLLKRRVSELRLRE